LLHQLVNDSHVALGRRLFGALTLESHGCPPMRTVNNDRPRGLDKSCTSGRRLPLPAAHCKSPPEGTAWHDISNFRLKTASTCSRALSSITLNLVYTNVRKCCAACWR